MGLESHITRSLQREKSGYVEGEDYWFSHGLTTSFHDVATEIAKILDSTGEFGPTDVIKHEGVYKVLFGVHPYWQK